MPAFDCLLCLLGVPSLSRLDNGEQISFRYRKAWALLGCLAVQPERWWPRAVLAARLWPQLPEAAALTNLRQVVADVTRALRPWGLQGVLAADRYRLRWQPQVRLRIDLQRLAEFGADDPAQASWAEESGAGWLAPFLDGLPAEPQPSGEDWLTQERLHWREQGIAALLRLGRQRDTQGRLPAAIAAVRPVWQQDPLHEEAAMQLMRWLQALGDARGAREVWTLTDNHWRAELGTPAPARLRALLQQAELAEAPPAGPVPVEETHERRWVAVLHLRCKPHDPNLPADDWDALQVRWLDLARRVLQGWQGWTFSAMGLRLDVCFGLGADPEPAAEQAVLAAQAVLAGTPPALQGAAGVVSGATLLSTGPFGLHLPARLPEAAQALAAQAGAGTVWVCGATAAQLRRRFVFAPRPATALPGSTSGPAAQVLQPLAVAMPPRLPAAPLLGRQAELAQLRQAWVHAQAGKPGWWLLLGPAGIGKSSLVTFFADEVSAAGGQVLRRPCSLALQQRPFGPWRADLGAGPETDWQPNSTGWASTGECCWLLRYWASALTRKICRSSCPRTTCRRCWPVRRPCSCWSPRLASRACMSSATP